MAATFDDVCNDSGALGQDRQLSYTSIFGVLRSPSRHIIWPPEDPVKVHIINNSVCLGNLRFTALRGIKNSVEK